MRRVRECECNGCGAMVCAHWVMESDMPSCNRASYLLLPVATPIHSHLPLAILLIPPFILHYQLDSHTHPHPHTHSPSSSYPLTLALVPTLTLTLALTLLLSPSRHPRGFSLVVLWPSSVGQWPLTWVRIPACEVTRTRSRL